MNIKIEIEMKKIILILPLILVMLSPAAANNLKKNVKGKWSVAKVETTDKSLNSMIDANSADMDKIIIELTEAGMVIVSGNDIKTKYKVNGDKIIFSEGVAKHVEKPEVKAKIKEDVLTVEVPAELVKEVMLLTKDFYVKAGGDALVARLIETAAKSYVIEGKVTLNRK